MSLTRRLAEVRLAQLRVVQAQANLHHASDSLLADSRAHPLTTLAVAAGAGTVLGTLKLPALRVPGMAGLLTGGLAEATALGARWLAELAAADATIKSAPATEQVADAVSSPAVDAASA